MIVLLKKATRYALAAFVIASLNFIIPRVMPGDPLFNLLGEDVQLELHQIEKLRSELGLDLPLIVRFGRYWTDLLRLDFGYSYHYHMEVFELIMGRLRWTLLLVGPSIVIGAIVGALLGALSGWYTGTASRLVTTFSLTLYSIPPYFLALVMLYLFSFKLGWFPLKGFYAEGGLVDILRHLFLPGLVLTLFTASRNTMIMRGSVIQERGNAYVVFARAKGRLGPAILFRHVFRNASLPLITMIALDFGFILSGALFVEIIFSMNGMGTLIYDALMSRDYPVLQGAFLLIMVMVITANLLADIIYSLIDPRVRLSP